VPWPPLNPSWMPALGSPGCCGQWPQMFPKSPCHSSTKSPVHNSMSDGRVSRISESVVQPHLVLRIARHLGPTEVRRVRAVSRFWYDTLDDMVKATEIWVAVLNDDALEKIARHSALSEQDKDNCLVPYGLVGYYSTEPGRYVARFKTMDLGRRVPRFDQDGF
ncbi:hypothetical protein BC829DRAFT_412302, partial [Chytridium lagenaria]